MSEKKITIRLETKDDYRNVENLTREAFWNVYRPGCMEYYVLHCYVEVLHLIVIAPIDDRCRCIAKEIGQLCN